MRKSKEIIDSQEKSRSVRRTKMALQKSLIELMKTQPVLRITVKDICNAADVGRSTFYAHYESHYELLEQIETECLSGFEDLMKEPLCKYNDREFTQWFIKRLQFIAENSNSIQTLLSENGDIFFQRKFFQSLVNQIKDTIKRNADNPVDDKISECQSVFFVHGTIALVQHWLKNNMRIPVSDFAKIFVPLIH